MIKGTGCTRRIMELATISQKVLLNNPVIVYLVALIAIPRDIQILEIIAPTDLRVPPIDVKLVHGKYPCCVAVKIRYDRCGSCTWCIVIDLYHRLYTYRTMPFLHHHVQALCRQYHIRHWNIVGFHSPHIIFSTMVTLQSILHFQSTVSTKLMFPRRFNQIVRYLLSRCFDLIAKIIRFKRASMVYTCLYIFNRTDVCAPKYTQLRSKMTKIQFQ